MSLWTNWWRTIQQLISLEITQALMPSGQSSMPWPIDKQITGSNSSHLLQHLLENEIVYSRKMEIDQLSEGLQVLGLLQVIQKKTYCLL